jgi:hypothetical protein
VCGARDDIAPYSDLTFSDPNPIKRLLQRIRLTLVALGSQHVLVQILANRIRLQKRPETLVAAHGLKGSPCRLSRMLGGKMVMTIITRMGMATATMSHHDRHDHGHHHHDTGIASGHEPI